MFFTDMTGKISGIAVGMLLAMQAAVGQPVAEFPVSRAVPQAYMTQLTRPINTVPHGEAVYDPGRRSHPAQSLAPLFERAMQAWVMLKPVPPLFPDDVLSYDGLPSEVNPAPETGMSTPEWLDGLGFLFRAGAALHDATSIETPDVLVELDPLSLRCTFRFKLNGGALRSQED